MGTAAKLGLAAMSEIILEPGLFDTLLRGRRAPNGKDATKYELFAESHIAQAVVQLRESGIEPTPAAVTAVILKELLKPAVWDDLRQRKEWFWFLLPTVQQAVKS